MWALYTALIFTAHQPVSAFHAAVIAMRAIVPAALLGLLVYRFTRRYPWPRPFRWSFVAGHFLAAALYSVSWMVLASVVESVVHFQLVIIGGGVVVPFLVLGVWLYVIVAGVSYATDATERAARAEAVATQSQLAALRAQLHPHFLFNALHTVVQLIPRQPERAAEAAEQVAALLRTTIEEDRDLVTLAEEWDFVQRYLTIERIRFADRMKVDTRIDDDTLAMHVPSFSLQTLVENAVRHGVAPNEQLTTIIVSSRVVGDTLHIEVHDSAAGVAPTAPGNGTGISRLRERLSAVYGDSARLQLSHDGGGFTALLVIPKDANLSPDE